jgi:Ca-activated chloride channel family protein
MRLLIVLAALCALPLFAQEAEQDASIQVDVNVVNLPVTVTDDEGRFIVDLKRGDFEVYEDGQKVDIRYFTESQDEANKPRIRVGFLVDLSNTARLYYKNYQESIGDLAFLMVPEGGDNEAFLIGYQTEVDLLVDYTRDPGLIADRMSKLKHGGGSSMVDAIFEACNNKLQSSPYQGVDEPRKVVVIVGDGHDNASKRSMEQAIFACQQQQVTVYSVSTKAFGFHVDEGENLKDIAEATGGTVVYPMEKIHKDINGHMSKPQDAGNYQYEVGTGLYARAQLEALYTAVLGISGQVQSQYIIGYSPPKPFSDNVYRQLDIRVNLNTENEVNVFHRKGYFPPTGLPASGGDD